MINNKYNWVENVISPNSQGTYFLYSIRKHKTPKYYESYNRTQGVQGLLNFIGGMNGMARKH